MKLSLIKPARLLLPREVPLERWCVVACDQYTSQPEYWERVRLAAGSGPSTLHLVYPECYLGSTDAAAYTRQINAAMSRYLSEGVFRELPDRYLAVERTLRSGRKRWGLMAALDLEAYDYASGSRSPIRATEGTVPQRIPPRAAVRRDAPLELPHVMVLMDDPEDTVLGPLKAAAASGSPCLTEEYRGRLMENSGSLRGWSLDSAAAAGVEAAVEALPAPDGMVLAVGDGNHSLATAKACFEELKQVLPREEWENHPARYALVELVNLYDPSLEFEPIHRLVTEVDPQDLLGWLREQLGCDSARIPDGAMGLDYRMAGQKGTLWTSHPSSPLEVGVLQPLLDRYTAQRGGVIDYIHGDDVLERLAQEPGSVGFLLPPMDKALLFPAVVGGGVLPRKTFSMGNAEDKRFYLECRRIR